MSRYRQSLLQLLAGVVALVLPLLTTSNLSTSEIFNVVILVVGAIHVWVAANLTRGVWRHTKLVFAALTAALVVLQSVISNGITGDEWKQIVVAFVGVILQTVLKNRPEVTASGPAETGPTPLRA